MAIDTSYASAVRRMLTGAQLAVDLFHVVQLAVKATGDVRCRVLLTQNLENLSPAQLSSCGC